MKLPPVLADPDWMKCNFILNADETILKEEHRRLTGDCFHPDLYKPKNALKLSMLRVQISAIRGYLDAFKAAKK